LLLLYCKRLVLDLAIPESGAYLPQPSTTAHKSHETLLSIDTLFLIALSEIDFVSVLALDLPNGIKLGETLQFTGRSKFIFHNRKIYQLTDYS